VVEEAHLGRDARRPGRDEGAVEDAGVAQVVEHQRGVLVGERGDGAHHGLVARGEERSSRSRSSGEALLELDVRRGGGLHAAAAEPAR
jgi:hypothetical protein